MKEEVFNQFVIKVCDLFKISRDEFFKVTKRREITDARQLVYFLCYKRPMHLKYIQNFMANNGYLIAHSTIIHGINVVGAKMAEDLDYQSIVKKIDNETFI
jgi:chromosomal replication initiation ATPase DnaA